MNREIIGNSPHIKELLNFIKKVAKTDSNVLLLGETGVGKELAAKKIHFLSDRKNRPFIKVNCANLNENLLESELFGYGKGAYTGAVIDKPGLLEEAEGGSFFLDEIADITPYLQAKFLSVIEDKEFRRLGENKTREVNVRFIIATNKDLYKLVENGKFRKDLYYRISILTFYITTLRKRKEDVPLLIKFFIEKESQRRSRNLTISHEALAKLLGYCFPGNVRELENILERAAIFSDNGIITDEMIEFHKIINEPRAKYKSRFPVEKIINTLVNYQGNKTRTAKELGISRVHLYRILNRLKEYNHESHFG